MQLREGVSAEYLWVRDASAKCIDVAPVSHGARSAISASLRCSADPSCEVLDRVGSRVAAKPVVVCIGMCAFSSLCIVLASTNFGYVAVFIIHRTDASTARCHSMRFYIPCRHRFHLVAKRVGGLGAHAFLVSLCLSSFERACLRGLGATRAGTCGEAAGVGCCQAWFGARVSSAMARLAGPGVG